MAYASEENLNENPNPNAKIGFVIFYPFQFYVFKNVYSHLADDAEFIIDGGRFFPLLPPPAVIEDCIKLLTKHGVSFRVLYYEDYQRQKYLADFFLNYKALVGLWRSGCLVIPQTDHTRKVHMNYGAGKELTMFWSRHRLWDLYLCLSPRIHRIISLLTWAEIVGYPKFDDWFNNKLDTVFIEGLKKGLDSSKKTLLYLPTHGDLGSIDSLAGELKKAAKDFNVIAKLHYYTPTEEPELEKKLEYPQILIYKDDIDLLPLLKIADVVVSDNSSAIFDAILADKPVAVTDFLSEGYLNKEHKKLRFFRFRLPEGALTYSQSIEQKIKRDGSVDVIRKPEELQEAVIRALADSPVKKNSRKKLRDELFSFNDGKCGQRAAVLIRQLLDMKILPEKPILYHVFEAEYQQFRPLNDSLSTEEKRTPVLSYWSFIALKQLRLLPLRQRLALILRELF